MHSLHWPEPAKLPRAAATAAATLVAAAHATPTFAAVRRGRALFLLWLLALAGCGGLDPVATHEATTDPTQLYMGLTLEHRAINLALAAPYHTVQLVATPRDGRDSVMSGLPAPSFRLLNPGDSTRLQVTPEGLVTALDVGDTIAVLAELVVPGPVRHEDTARVTVKAAPPTLLDNLSVEPASAESARWPMNMDRLSFFFDLGGVARPTLMAQTLDAAGQPIHGLVVEYTSLDPERATVDAWTGKVFPRRPGPVAVVARTLAYGVPKADTALYTVSWPIEVVIGIVSGPGGSVVFLPREVRVRSGALLMWRNDLADTVDVTFDNPTQVASTPALLCNSFLFPLLLPAACTGEAGNVLVPAAESEPYQLFPRFRSFPVAGVYPYHSIRTGVTGRIVVTDEVSTEAAEP